MITPRVTRLLRAADLHAFQEAIVSVLPAGWAARSTAVLVPGRSAAEELRRTIEEVRLSATSAAAIVFPDLLTRGELYGRLHEKLAGAPPMLSEFDREVLLRLASEVASAAGVQPPFRLRPGLIAAILGFYDELRRQARTIDTLDRVIGERLEAGREADRGAERLFRQTQFLAAAFAAFERRSADSGGIDEHGLRTLLLSSAEPSRYRHVVVSIADRAAEQRGLWPVDFDLLSRLPGVERIDVVATERLLAAGWHQRLHDVLPEIEEARVECPSIPPIQVAPPVDGVNEPAAIFVFRDREEELAGAARWIKSAVRASAGAPRPLERTAIVFQRPLPYLYLASQVFGQARIPYQAADSLPLAAEPYAAALDLVFAVAAEDATRAALVALLTSPHWTFRGAEDNAAISRADVAALDRVLLEAKFLGGWQALASLAAAVPERSAGASRRAAHWRRAARALAAALALAPLFERMRNGATTSQQISALLEFVAAFEAPAPDGFDRAERHHRARAAIVGALVTLREAHARHDDRALAVTDLWATVRRWIEGQTFSPRTGTGGLRLLDAAAAPYARLDAMRLVGLVESDWPERSSASIFYPASLLRDLGWPAEADRAGAARARFDDLLLLPAREVSASAFTFEEDAIVAVSPFVENVAGSGLRVERPPMPPFVRIFEHEALSLPPVDAAMATTADPAWLARRTSRTAAADARFHGTVGGRAPVTYAVSHVERYLECPFKYFAGQVLRLEEEREDESGLTPLERGQLLHGVFEAFYVAWHERGRSAVTTADLEEALALFEDVAESQLQGLPEGDRALERTYLLGSAASPGLAERAFAVEIEQGIGVVERLLEYEFEGTFTFAAEAGERQIAVRGKADRIDVLADGSLRIIDYKLGRAPKAARALQLPIYGVCAQQQIERERGLRLPIARAGYVAFKEKNAFIELGGRSGSIDGALREGQQRFLDAIARIESGEYPPAPDEPWTCTRCGFPHVCRKDYVGDE